MKYYAVRQGRQVGIFTSWDECKRLVTGYKGAEYKSFTDKASALAFLENTTPSASVAPDADTVIAYVDGSYNIKTQIFACGVVIITADGEKYLSQSYDDKELATMRNVAGEIKGSIAAMEYCLENGIKNLHIFYDYAGIEKWCNGEWKTNKCGTMDYKRFYDSICDKLSITFHKVKGHSGDKYNDMADKLAKKAAGIG